jgi:hypothetical protein
MSSAEKPTKEEFAQIMLAAIHKHDATPLRYDPDEFRLIEEGEPTEEGEAKYSLNLSNAYREYCAASTPTDAESTLERYCSVWCARHADKSSPATDILPNLRPVIRLRSYYELTRLQLQPQLGHLPPPFPYRALGEYYALGLMHIQGNSLGVVAQHHLDEWNLDFETALAAATDNLREHTNEPLKQLVSGVWYGFWEDDFGPSRLLFPDLLECEIHGDPVVLLAERRVLILTGSDDETGLLAAAHAAENLAEDGRPVGALPLRLHEDGEWRPFLPPGNSEAGKKIRLRWLKSQQGSYEDQAGHLAALGDGPGAADYHVFQGREDIPPFSFCIWQQGEDELLPRTDRVLFALPDEEGGEPMVRAEVRWAKVLELVGDLMERQEELFPERWRVRTFPDASRLVALRSASGT